MRSPNKGYVKVPGGALIVLPEDINDATVAVPPGTVVTAPAGGPSTDAVKAGHHTEVMALKVDIGLTPR